MKTCKDCGVEFEDRSHTKTKEYCGHACRVRGWRTRNPLRTKQSEAEYFQKNKSALQANRTKRHRERYKTDVQYRIKDILRSRLLKALRRNIKTGSAVDDLGCSIDELKAHLESQFQPGMSWENQGKGKDKWNIDHIVPLKKFDLSNPEELKKACNYKNLQPLWETDHYKKTSEE